MSAFGRLTPTVVLIVLALLVLSPPSAGAQTDGQVIQPAEGQGVYRTLHSRVLGQDRLLLVSLPSSYSTDTRRRYPVLYMFDGSPESLAWGAMSVRRDWQWPDMIVVAIANIDRQKDMTITGFDGRLVAETDGAFRFLDFLTAEVIPFVETAYRASGYRILFGHSSAGTIVLHAFVSKAECFDSFISSSPHLAFDHAFLEEKTKSVLSAGRTAGKMLHIVYGAGDAPATSRYVPHYQAVLARAPAADFRHFVRVIPDRGHGSLTMLSEGIAWTFADYAFPTEAFLKDGRKAVETRLALLAKKYRLHVTIEEFLGSRVFLVAAGDLVRQGRLEDGIRLYEFGREVLPGNTTLAYFLGQTLMHAGQKAKAIATLSPLLSSTNQTLASSARFYIDLMRK